jgi:excisionase family DNA binding protein
MPTNHKPALKTTRDLKTTAQAMAQLGCSRGTIDKLARDGKLERVPFGGQTRITARSLDALVDELLSEPEEKRGRR